MLLSPRFAQKRRHCMHAQMFFNYNIAAKIKMKTLVFNSLAPNTRFERLAYANHEFFEL